MVCGDAYDPQLPGIYATLTTRPELCIGRVAAAEDALHCHPMAHNDEAERAEKHTDMPRATSVAPWGEEVHRNKNIEVVESRGPQQRGQCCRQQRESAAPLMQGPNIRNFV